MRGQWSVWGYRIPRGLRYPSSIDRRRSREDHLLDLDASELDVSLDLESGDVVGVRAVSERGETLAVDEDLQNTLLVPLGISRLL